MMIDGNKVAASNDFSAKKLSQDHRGPEEIPKCTGTINLNVKRVRQNNQLPEV